MRNISGFTLIEVLVVITIIGILAAGAYLTLGTLLDKARYDSTVETMNTLKTVIIGNPSLLANGIRTDFGYLNGMGRLPLTLPNLANQGTQPVYATLTNCGWNGPYVRSKFQDDPDGYQRDGWGNLFQYNSVTGIITSLGSDGVAGGSGYAADISSENLSAKIRSNIKVEVFDYSGNSGTGFRIDVYSPSSGIEATTNHTLIAGDNGRWTFTNIPVGNRRVAVFNGAIKLDEKWVVVIDSADANLVFSLKDSIAPNPPTGLTVTRAALDQLNLSWTASTSTDVQGYNIYRNIGSSVANPPLLFSNITALTFSDTGLSPATTYYYKLKSADKSGNLSTAYSNEANEVVSPIIQGTTVTTGQDTDIHTFYISNLDPSAILITTMSISWSSQNTSQLNRIRIAGNTRWSRASGVSSPANVTFSTTYNLAGSANNIAVQLRFENNITIDWLSVQFNQADGYFYVGY